LSELLNSVFFKCDICHIQLSTAKMVDHFQSTCPKQEVTCEFNCSHKVSLTNFKTHLTSCPSRPVKCQVCEQEIKLSEAHDQSKCEVVHLRKKMSFYKYLLESKVDINNPDELMTLHHYQPLKAETTNPETPIVI
jgi:hypothetical protein